MVSVILITFALFVLCGAVHYGVISGLRDGLAALRISHGFRLQLGLIGIALAHIFEAALYAIGFQYAQGQGLGGFTGADSPISNLDIFYFSLDNYTSLGLGDVVTTGHLRFMAGAETLNGFLLIACSAAFLFSLMRTRIPREASA